MMIRRRGLFVAAIAVFLQLSAHANEVAIAYCADADKISISDGVDADCVSAWNKDPVSGVIGIQKGPL